MAARLSLRFLSSKVARRIFLLFVICALVPLTALALVSFVQVSNQLYDHAEGRLDVGARSVGQGIFQRLRLAETELRFPEATAPDAASLDANTGVQDPLGAQRFLGVARLTDAQREDVYGVLEGIPDIDAEGRRHLDQGGTLLSSQRRPGGPPLIYLIRADVDAAGVETLTVGSVNPRYLWAGGADTLDRDNQLCVFGPRSMPFFCTRPIDANLPGEVLAAVARDHAGNFEWTLGTEEYLAAYWTIPLASQFSVLQWKVMLSESRDSILEPMASFRQIFPLIILVSMWVVLLLSISQIRRSMMPLESLREGTRKIGEGDFDSVVEVSSGDEFEELADSFNIMAGRLGKQFNALATIAEIDRTILSSLDIEKIVGTVLRHTSELIDCHALSITLVSPDQQKVPRTYVLRNAPGTRPWVETTFFDRDDLRRFAANPDFLRLGPQDGAPAFLTPLARSGCQRFVVFPMFINDEPAGAISLGFAGEISYDEDDLQQARQLTNQVAVALANAHLVEDLDALNWGALTALARAVDAKSPWTAGHSERVTTMGVKIGETMQLEKDELDVLHRGGLLHDLGKIGVPAAILDKPGKLTEEEYDLMKKHPEIGANILQPIAAYADVIPIVRQHHERWDGKGYPDGLKGRQIHQHARIFAVADVYDAIISDRPYRAGMDPDKVIGIIVEGDGSHFETVVVDAFLEVMSDEGHDVGAHKAARLRQATTAS